MGTEVEMQLKDAVVTGATLLLKKQSHELKSSALYLHLAAVRSNEYRFQNLLLSFEFSVSPEALIIAFQEARPTFFLARGRFYC